MKIILNKYFRADGIVTNFILIEMKFFTYLRDFDYANYTLKMKMYVYTIYQ